MRINHCEDPRQRGEQRLAAWLDTAPLHLCARPLLALLQVATKECDKKMRDPTLRATLTRCCGATRSHSTIFHLTLIHATPLTTQADATLERKIGTDGCQLVRKRNINFSHRIINTTATTGTANCVNGDDEDDEVLNVWHPDGACNSDGLHVTFGV